MKKSAFTLAEVLITLGIIGVVAAMTIPLLISGYRKSVIETRLKVFYSNINQAIIMSEKDNGDIMGWDKMGYPTPLAWYKNYLANYLQTLSVDSTSIPGSLIIYFPNGSASIFNLNIWNFFPEAKEVDNFIAGDTSGYGTKVFPFGFWPTLTDGSHTYHYNKGMEPYKYNWDGTVNTLWNNNNFGCKLTATNFIAYCTALIELNGWKIPDNYPFKF